MASAEEKKHSRRTDRRQPLSPTHCHSDCRSWPRRIGRRLAGGAGKPGRLGGTNAGLLGGDAGGGAAPGGGAGGTKVGSIFGWRVFVPVGPVSDTSRGVIRSICQPLMVSPSLTMRGLAPFGAKIANRRPGVVTIPARRVSASPESTVAPSLFAGGRRVALNSGRARISATMASEGGPRSALATDGGGWAGLCAICCDLGRGHRSCDDFGGGNCGE